ncbi:phosphorylase superfamily domain-containing protein [Ditylenchus destructor]|nr:phosphorylase superfamily domain-containing protein [Ditylenchus destructor]
MFANNGLLIANHCDLVQPTKNGTTIAKKAIPATNGKIVKKTPGVNGITRIASSQDSAKKVETNGVEKLSINPRNYDDLVRLCLEDSVAKESLEVLKLQGHKGNLVFGHLNNAYVMCLQGRFHPYEHNMDLTLCSMPVRIMHLLGVKTLIISNAAGGVNSKLQYGDLMLIKDHIFMPGLSGFSPLVGSEIATFKVPGFQRELRNERCPQYESPANWLTKLSGGEIGMSTCHEVTVARQCGMRVISNSKICFSCNTDADSSVEVSHEEVLQAGQEPPLVDLPTKMEMGECKWYHIFRYTKTELKFGISKVKNL